MQEDLDAAYAEIEEKREKKASIFRNIPRAVLIGVGIMIVVVIAYLTRNTGNMKGILITLLVGAVIIVLVSMQGVKEKEFLGEEEIVPIAIQYLGSKLNILQDNFSQFKDGKFYLTAHTTLREWDGNPWRWYVYWNWVSDETKRVRWFATVFCPRTGKCKGTEEYMTRKSGTELPHIKMFVPPSFRFDKYYKNAPFFGGTGTG